MSKTAMKIEQIDVEDLIPYARNARTHSEQQVTQIAASIREFGFNNPVLIDGQSTIIAGHGRVLAAKKLGLDRVPCIRLTHMTDAQRRAYILADNRIALNSGWDDAMLALELQGLETDGLDLGLVGFDEAELQKLLQGMDLPAEGIGEEAQSQYTNEIKAPVYEPKGERPAISELSDNSKALALIAEVKAAKLPADVEGFLIAAAARHVVFNFRNIAEFYCHASADVQNLMERSGLIIIDFKKAIEYGFVHLSEALGKIADIELGDDDDAA
jgi:hypothetical protein